VAELSDADWEKLTRDLSARVAVFSPDWTEWEANDPGITLMELFAFLTESLFPRGDVSPDARARLRDVLARLERAGDAGCKDGTLSRNRFFTGKALTADDFEQEQSYHRIKHRRHNRLLHGVGIVSGLGVGLQPGSTGDDAVVVVSPGVAIAPDGEELVVCEQVTRDACRGESVCYVTAALVEQPGNPTPSGEPSRIQETAEVAVSEDIPPGHLAIARLLRDSGAWAVDPSFEPARSVPRDSSDASVVRGKG
jgi:hypothetical protein